jgi:hypothetical protein
MAWLLSCVTTDGTISEDRRLKTKHLLALFDKTVTAFFPD